MRFNLVDVAFYVETINCTYSAENCVDCSAVTQIVQFLINSVLYTEYP